MNDSGIVTLRKLRAAWGLWAALNLVVLGGGYIGLGFGWGSTARLAWLGISAGLVIYQLNYLWHNLEQNIQVESDRLQPRLGTANWMSLARGLIVALLAGMAIGPRPTGWLAWIPGPLFLLAVCLDFGDGWVARRSGMTTRLGERLDMQQDGFSVLVGSVLVVRYGLAPVFYLLVGLARYLFLAGEWLHRRQYRPLRRLLPNPARRALAGAQMGFIAVVLFPLFQPLATTLAATLFMLPFLVNFLRDWLWVSGGLVEQPAGFGPQVLVRQARMILPVLLRAALVGLLGWSILQPAGISWLVYMNVAQVLLAISLLTGAAGRFSALAAMILSGVLLQVAPADPRYWLVLVGSLCLFYTGTGPYSLWKPEDWLIYHRAGETGQS